MSQNASANAALAGWQCGRHALPLRLLPGAVGPGAVGTVRAAERPRPVTPVRLRTGRNVPEGGEPQVLLAAAVTRQRAEGLDVLGPERVVDGRGRVAARNVLGRAGGGNRLEGLAAGNVVCMHVCPND